MIEFAVEVAGGPPTKKQIEDVAARHFNWFPKAKKPKDKPPLQLSLERHLKGILGIPLTPREVVAEFGDPAELEGFIEARDYINDIYNARPGKGES